MYVITGTYRVTPVGQTNVLAGFSETHPWWSPMEWSIIGEIVGWKVMIFKRYHAYHDSDPFLSGELDERFIELASRTR